MTPEEKAAMQILRVILILSEDLTLEQKAVVYKKIAEKLNDMKEKSHE